MLLFLAGFMRLLRRYDGVDGYPKVCGRRDDTSYTDRLGHGRIREIDCHEAARAYHGIGNSYAGSLSTPAEMIAANTEFASNKFPLMPAMRSYDEDSATQV